MDYKIYKNLDHQIDKKNKFKIRVSTYIQGELKNKFMQSCINKKICEADFLREIISTHFKK
jgi:hypothetical protein